MGTNRCGARAEHAEDEYNHGHTVRAAWRCMKSRTPPGTSAVVSQSTRCWKNPAVGLCHLALHQSCESRWPANLELCGAFAWLQRSLSLENLMNAFQATAGLSCNFNCRFVVPVPASVRPRADRCGWKCRIPEFTWTPLRWRDWTCEISHHLRPGR